MLSLLLKLLPKPHVHQFWLLKLHPALLRQILLQEEGEPHRQRLVGKDHNEGQEMLLLIVPESSGYNVDQ